MARVRIEPGGKVLIAAVILCVLLLLFLKIKAGVRVETQRPPEPAAVSAPPKPTDVQTENEIKPQQEITKNKDQAAESPAYSYANGNPVKIFFDFNRSNINKNVYCIFDRIEEAVRANGAREIRIVVQGNADSIGPQRYNFKLSRIRAAHVADSLSKRLRIPLKNIKLVANGSTKPVSSNATRAGRAENRRTEVVIY